MVYHIDIYLNKTRKHAHNESCIKFPASSKAFIKNKHILFDGISLFIYCD